jgi:ADP-ribose pyrophosphatase YjhB (NUDIX family)
MATQGAFSIIINIKNNKILLVRRKDWRVWDLPGGRVEKNESEEICAIRETLEETGFKIKVIKKIGAYNRPSRNDTQHVFLAEIAGGNAITTGD